MYQAPEQLVALNKANLEVAMKFAGVAIQGAERIMELQMKAAKSAFSDSVVNAKAIASVKDVQQLAALKDDLAQPAFEKATAYAKSVYDVTAATQAELGKLVEEQVAEYNKQVVATLDKMARPLRRAPKSASLRSSRASLPSTRPTRTCRRSRSSTRKPRSPTS